MEAAPLLAWGRVFACPCCCSSREGRCSSVSLLAEGGLAGVPLPAAGWRYSQACRCSPASAARRLPLLAGHARCSPSSFNCCKPLLAHRDAAGHSHAASVASTKQAGAAARYLVIAARYLAVALDAVARCMISHCSLHSDWKAHSSTMLTALLQLTCMGLAQMLSLLHEWDGLQSIVA
ncbi:hypothetical protein Dimus_029328, partial [Dionaea muscipula]